MMSTGNPQDKQEHLCGGLLNRRNIQYNAKTGLEEFETFDITELGTYNVMNPVLTVKYIITQELGANGILQINKTSGTLLVNLSRRTNRHNAQRTFSLIEKKKNYAGFGEAINENFLHILENFANSANQYTQWQDKFGGIQQNLD